MMDPSPSIRAAVEADAAAIAACVEEAYRPYVARIGKPPAPMLENYTRVIADARVFVLSAGETTIGVAVLWLTAERALLENVAVRPRHQSAGWGRMLIAAAERAARAAGYSAIELYTHELMSENIALYGALGYREFNRKAEDGYRRIYMRKSLVSNSG